MRKEPLTSKTTLLGVHQLKKPLHCQAKALDQLFVSSICGFDLAVMFPSREGLSMDESSDNLCAPRGLFKREGRRWGCMRNSEKELYDVEGLVFCFPSVPADSVQKIYDAFPQWTRRLEKLALIAKGEFIQPDTNPSVVILRDIGGFYNGLLLYSVDESNGAVPIANKTPAEVTLEVLTQPEICFSFQELTELFASTGSSKAITTPYDLLQEAYQLLLHDERRNSVITAGTAVETAMLHQLTKYYDEDHAKDYAKRRKRYSGLGGKFKWFRELGIVDTVAPYEKVISDPRNKATHEGIVPDLKTTKTCLAACRAVIQKCCSNVLEE